MSGPEGTPTRALPPGFTRHQALAIPIRSPHGLSMSPYLKNIVLRKNEV